MVSVKVPATSANIGAGFDSLGLAVSLYNYVYFDWADEPQIKSLDRVHIPTTKENLIYKSAMYLFKICGEKKIKPIKILQKNNIPMARGLGSSSCCIVAGLFGANALLGNVLNKKELLKIAAKIEGHPDNVAPCILGGFVASAIDEGRVFYVKNNISPGLKFVFLVPNFKLSTAKSRKVLREQVPLKDAVYNISRASLLVSSILKGKFYNLNVAVKDKLHQDYRLKYIEGAEDIFKLSYGLGACAVYLSGAGPSIVAICDRSNRFFEKNISLKLKEKNMINWRVLKLDIDNKGVVGRIT